MGAYAAGLRAELHGHLPRGPVRAGRVAEGRAEAMAGHHDAAVPLPSPGNRQGVHLTSARISMSGPGGAVSSSARAPARKGPDGLQPIAIRRPVIWSGTIRT